MSIRTSISLSKAIDNFRRADSNQDGQVSRREAAREAVRLRNEGKTNEYRLWGTFVAGGSNDDGLFPDTFNSSGRLGQNDLMSLADLADLARADATDSAGDAGMISWNDFKARFGTKAEDARSLSFAKVQLAGEQAVGDDDSSSSLLRQLLPFLLQNLFAQQGGVGSPNPYGGSASGWGGPLGSGNRPGGNNPLMSLLLSRLGGDSQSDSGFDLSSLLGSLGAGDD